MSADQFVYILSNSFFSEDTFKIGSTKVNPSDRAYQLQSTGVPIPFTVEYIIITHNCRELEQKIHEHLRNFRVSQNREFFKIEKNNLCQILTDEMTLQLIPFSEFHYKSPIVPTPEPTSEAEHESESDTETNMPVTLCNDLDVVSPDHVQNNDLLYCQVCDITLSSIYALRKHLKTNLHKKKLNPVQEKFSCLCGRQYTHRPGLYKHRKFCEIYKNPPVKKEEKKETQKQKVPQQLQEKIIELEKKLLEEKIDKMQLQYQIQNLKHKLEITEMERKLSNATKITSNTM